MSNHFAHPMALLQTYLVEDSPVIRESLIATLEELAPVKVVGSAEEEDAALLWLSVNRVDLVIVDLFLKGGSGLGVLRAAQQAQQALRAQQAQQPPSHPGEPGERGERQRYVVLTNYATPAMRERCLELGADGVFDKSTEIDALLTYCAALAQQRG